MFDYVFVRFGLETDMTFVCVFSLVIMGNDTEFEKGVRWLSENLTFDVDARINLFEVNV